MVSDFLLFQDSQKKHLLISREAKDYIEIRNKKDKSQDGIQPQRQHENNEERRRELVRKNNSNSIQFLVHINTTQTISSAQPPIYQFIKFKNHHRHRCRQSLDPTMLWLAM